MFTHYVKHGSRLVPILNYWSVQMSQHRVQAEWVSIRYRLRRCIDGNKVDNWMMQLKFWANVRRPQYYSRVMKKPAFQWPVQVSCGFFLSNMVLIKRMQSPSTKEILKAQGGGRWVSILHVRLCSIYDCSLSIYILPYAFYWSIVAGEASA